MPVSATQLSRAIAGMGAVALACLPALAAAGEPETDECPVVAAAQGVQVMVSASDNLFLQAPTGAAIPVAQACVDHGVEESYGFASSPYPGETIVSAPALLRGSIGENGQPLPDYPVYVSSRHPSVAQSASEQQGYSLSSRSTETSTRAQARTGLGQDAASAETTALAEATVDPAKQAATATATSVTQPLTINGVLRLGQVHSTATATVGADGKLTRDSQLQIGRTEVAGQVAEITRDGVRFAGQTAPLPGEDPTAALEAAGVRVRYLAAEQTQQGVVSAGVEVLARQQDTQSGAVYTVHYVFGRAFASSAPVEGAADAGGDTGSAGEAPPAIGPAATDLAPAGAAPLPEQAPPPSPAGPDSAPAPAVAAAPVGLVGNPVDMGVTGLYLMLAFGAVATFAFGTLLRLLGVKTRWTS